MVVDVAKAQNYTWRVVMLATAKENMNNKPIYGM